MVLNASTNISIVPDDILTVCSRGKNNIFILKTDANVLVESVKVQTQSLRMGLLKQLGAMKLILHQSLSLRGHIEHEGNME